MARPIKAGLDYFPLDTARDTKFKLIEAEYGLKGFAIVIKAYQKIYGEEGYYMEWTEEVGLLFAEEIKADWSLVSEIILASIKRGIFDKELYESYQVLSSRGIQKRYLAAVNRRKEITVDARYLLVPYEVIKENENIKLINVSRNFKKVSSNPQRKRNKTKTKEREEEAHTHTLYGKLNNLCFSDAEYQDIQNTYQRHMVLIDKISLIVANARRKYNSHYALLLKVAEEDGWAKKKKTDEPLKAEVPKKQEPMPDEIKMKMKGFGRERRKSNDRN
jgi:hypothetical protein